MYVYPIKILLLLFLFSACSFNNDQGFTENKMKRLKFPVLNKDSLDFAEIYENKINVLIFLSPECPLCIKYTFAINEITNEYQNDEIAFYGIFPGKTFTKEEILEYVNKYDLNFKMVLDQNYIITSYLNAKVTPEVFILDNQGILRYEGAIDNWMVTLGRMRQNITEFYLKDALESLINDKTVHVKKTKAVGCLIE